jgi:hypothetical protein
VPLFLCARLSREEPCASACESGGCVNSALVPIQAHATGEVLGEDTQSPKVVSQFECSTSSCIPTLDAGSGVCVA